VIRNRRRTLTKKSAVKPLTAKQRREVAVLVSMSDNAIDYSDIPPLKDRFWKRAVGNPFYRQQ
jgi:hypothetical protein